MCSAAPLLSHACAGRVLPCVKRALHVVGHSTAFVQTTKHRLQLPQIKPSLQQLRLVRSHQCRRRCSQLFVLSCWTPMPHHNGCTRYRTVRLPVCPAHVCYAAGVYISIHIVPKWPRCASDSGAHCRLAIAVFVNTILAVPAGLVWFRGLRGRGCGKCV